VREKFVKLSITAAVLLAVAQTFGFSEDQLTPILENIAAKLTTFFHLPAWFLLFVFTVTFTYIVYTISLRALKWMVPFLWAFIVVWFILYNVGVIPFIEKLLGVSVT